MPPLNYDRMIAEIRGGLKCARQELDEAREAQAFYDFEGERYAAWRFAREAESPADQQMRPYRPSGFTREIVEVLCEHLYSPGPSRRWSDAAGQELLDRVYADNDIQGLMADADELATLNDCCAIQIDAGDGDFGSRPCTLRIWSRDQFHVFTDPRDALKPVAVVTIDEYDETRRYRLWTDEEVRTFETSKAGLSGGTAPQEVPGSPEPNTYGELPFAFVHYKRPVRKFFEPGLQDLIVKAEIRINDRLSRLDESIHKHLNPLPTAKNVPADWQPIVEPMRFIRLRSSGGIGASGGYDRPADPELSLLQATIDIAGAWLDTQNYAQMVLEAARVPMSSVRMEQTGVASGIALVVEQAPLLTRARRRRGPFARYELDLARKVLACLGRHYGRPQLVASAASGRLSLAWPQPSIPIPTQDRLDMLTSEVRGGYKSHVQAVGEWYGVDRDQAVEILRQIDADTKELSSILTEPPSVPGEPDPAADPNQTPVDDTQQ